MTNYADLLFNSFRHGIVCFSNIPLFPASLSHTILSRHILPVPITIETVTTFLSFCLIAGICYYISLPDYHVRNSMSFSNQGTRDTELTVIVYKYWGIDETIRKIETEHNKINGTPTTLEINLYYSAWLIRYGEKPFKTVVFEYD